MSQNLATQNSGQVTAKPLEHLYRLSSFHRSDLLQPNMAFDKLYQLAHNGQIELELLLNRVAKQSNAELLMASVKGEQRAKEKVTTELNGNHRALTDLARATLVGRDIEQIVSIYSELSNQSHLVLLLNRFLQPKANGYRDLKVLLRLPKTGMVAEVQIHLKAIEKVKDGEEHRLYQQVQRIERLAERESRPLIEWELAKINRLKRFSRALYEEAWQRYLPANAYRIHA